MARTTLLISGAALAAALTACSGSPPAHPAHTSHTATVTLPTVSKGDAGRVCAAINALAVTGSAHPLATVDGTAALWFPHLNKTLAVAAAVRERCPQFERLLPKADR